MIFIVCLVVKVYAYCKTLHFIGIQVDNRNVMQFPEMHIAK